MTITINSQFSHQVNPAKATPADNEKKEKIKNLLVEMASKNNQEVASDIKWNGDQLELNRLSALTLHTFLLEAEKQGLNISLEKKTLIKLS